MIYRNLGPTGLKVSVIGYGNAFNFDPKDFDRDYEIIKTLVDNGVNFFDTAEWYEDGAAEIQLGKILKKLNKPREDLVITTKIYKIGTNVNSLGTSRKHLIEGVLNSLKILQLDDVEVVFAHRQDRDTPMEETVRAFNWLIENNKAFYWGTSEWEPHLIMEAHAVCDRLGLIHPVVEQPQYNMLIRQRMEVDYAELFDKHGMGTTIWSPLAQGFLTGKYNKGIPADSRFADPKKAFLKEMAGYTKYFEGPEAEKTFAKFEALGAIAKELGATFTQLAVAWAIRNKDVSTAILGATKVEQIKDSLGAVQILPKLTNEIEERILKVLDNTPKTAVNFKTWTPFAPRR